jgi:hypothetical protein
MSVTNGQLANQTIFNAAFMSRNSDTSTTGVVDLDNSSDPDSGAQVENAQQAINETFDALGMTGIDDANRKVYSSHEIIASGDDRKVAIGKLDAALAVLQNTVLNATADRLKWYPSGTFAPSFTLQQNVEIMTFTQDSEDDTYIEIACAVFRVPDAYVEGQLLLRNALFYSATNSGNVLFRTKSYILKAGKSMTDAFGSACHTSTNAQQAVSGTAGLASLMDDVDITDADGEIDNVPIAAGDRILIEFYRDNINHTSGVADSVNVLTDSFEPIFV